MCVATLCGYRSYSAMADWGRCYGQKLARALGFTHAKTPCAATLYHVLRQLDGPLVEATLGAWAESVLHRPAPGPRRAGSDGPRWENPAGQSQARGPSRPSALGAQSSAWG